MAAKTDKQRLEALEKRVEQIALDLATATVHLLSVHGARPALTAVIGRNDPDRLAVEQRPASVTGREVVSMTMSYRSDSNWGALGVSPNVPEHERSPHEQQVMRRWRRQEAEKAKREADHQAAESSRWERFRAKVRREAQERDEAEARDAETLAAMSPEALARHYAKHPPLPSDRVQRLPTQHWLALDDDRRERAKAEIAEREKRERDLGLAKLQKRHAARIEEFHQERLAAERIADDAKRAAREREHEQLEALGPCPTLESLEGVMV
jgi:hypothetical protein